MTALMCRRTTVASALALILLAGGCSGTAPKQSTEPSLVMSASPGTLQSVLPPADSEADLTVDRGVAAALDEEFASGEYADLRSVIVLADGRTAYERYFQSAPSDYHHVYSVTKSVLSTLVGIAIADGAIPGVSATLAELLPDKSEDMTKSVANTTLEQLLTMMAGFTSQVPGPTVTDWVADILEQGALEPGSNWSYSDNGAHLVSAVLAEATGMPVLDYARATLFDPLGIPSTPAAQQDVRDPEAFTGPGFGWAVDPRGVNVGGFGLRLRAQDMAKLGLLYLQDGVWEGQQVVPSDWISRATTEQADNGDGGYGYLWWVDQIDGDPAYTALGRGGQRIWVIPNRELVVVYQVWTDPAAGPQAVAGKIDDAFVSLIAPAYKS
ncbi:MAG: serine hydrolase [Candidatus Nanopelagicales bacterium]